MVGILTGNDVVVIYDRLKKFEVVEHFHNGVFMRLEFVFRKWVNRYIRWWRNSGFSYGWTL